MKTTLLTLLTTASIYCSAAAYPPIIDLGTLNYSNGHVLYDQTQPWTSDLVWVKYDYEPLAFNNAPEIGAVLQSLCREHSIYTVIETGTFTGSTTRYFGETFHRVHTIEILDDLYTQSVERLSDFSNVVCHRGSSEQVLKYILPLLKDKPIMFYLDAHGNGYWPLLDEIREIGKTHKDNCIIVIDDFKVPGRGDIAYDAWGEHECSYEYTKKALDEAFTDYSYYYLIPPNVNSRAKFIVIPKNLK